MYTNVVSTGKHHAETAHGRSHTSHSQPYIILFPEKSFTHFPRKAWLFLSHKQKAVVQEEKGNISKSGGGFMNAWGVYGCFQNSLTRPMMRFEAEGSRAVTGMLKCSRKGARCHEISKLILGYSPFFSAITGCNQKPTFTKTSPGVTSDTGEPVCAGQS